MARRQKQMFQARGLRFRIHAYGESHGHLPACAPQEEYEPVVRRQGLRISSDVERVASVTLWTLVGNFAMQREGHIASP